MPVTATESWRWDLILDGAVRRYPSGREVCTDTERGRTEYKRRLDIMKLRQHNICGRGAHLIVNPTFDHATNSRGLGGAKRDDRIETEEGPINCCSCWTCNSQAGSRRI